MKIAGDLCIYTNHTTTVEVLKAEQAAEDVNKLTLAYWDARGKGAQVHYILNYLGVAYDTKEYVRGPSPDFHKTDWQ